MRACTAFVALALSGCLSPRSAVLGQTASPLGPGAKEVSLSMGAAYQSQLAPPVTQTDAQGRELPSQLAARGFSVPAFEANLHLGVTDTIGFNLHASPAGLEPGMKLTLLRGRASLALMPHGALGYGSSASVTQATGVDGRITEVAPSTVSTFTWMAGLEALASHRSGLYGGVGYALQSVTVSTSSISGSGNATQPIQSTTGSIQHHVSAAIGFDIRLDRVHLRPEIAAVLTPLLFSSTSDGAGRVVSEGGGGWGFLVMPTFTVAVASEPDKTDRGREEDEAQLDRGSDGGRDAEDAGDDRRGDDPETNDWSN